MVTVSEPDVPWHTGGKEQPSFPVPGETGVWPAEHSGGWYVGHVVVVGAVCERDWVTEGVVGCPVSAAWTFAMTDVFAPND